MKLKKNRMFRSIGLVLICLLCLISCNNELALSKSDKRYYKYVKEAELALVNEQYAEANKAYKLAFNENGKHFIDDSFNALHAARRVGDTGFMYNNAFTLAQLGLCPELFERIDELKSNANYFTELIEIARSKSNNTIYRDDLEQMLNDDQSVRYNRHLHPEKVKEVDSLNYILFKEYISKRGLPLVDVIYARCSSSQEGIDIMPYMTPLTHFSQNKSRGVEHILWDLLQHRQISPEYYGRHRGYTNPIYELYTIPVVVMENDFYTYDLKKRKQAKANKKRKAVGMHTIENHIEIIDKVRTLRKTGSFEFRLPVVFEVLDYNPELLEESILKPLEIL